MEAWSGKFASKLFLNKKFKNEVYRELRLASMRVGKESKVSAILENSPKTKWIKDTLGWYLYLKGNLKKTKPNQPPIPL